mgnify:CR=1 FL=1
MTITLAVTILLVLSFFVFPPQKISIPSGFEPDDYYTQKCRGLYIQTYDTTSVDGGRGGWCWGKVQKVLVKRGN